MDIGVLQSDCDEPLQKKALDKFYTKSSITKLCVKHLLGVLIKIGYDIKEITFIEPSAGGGAWVKTLEENNIITQISSIGNPITNEKISNMIIKNSNLCELSINIFSLLFSHDESDIKFDLNFDCVSD